MTVRVVIHTENFAFEGAGLYTETARILRDIARKLETRTDDYSMYRTLFDFNGNDVGHATFKDES